MAKHDSGKRGTCHGRHFAAYANWGKNCLNGWSCRPRETTFAVGSSISFLSFLLSTATLPDRNLILFRHGPPLIPIRMPCVCQYIRYCHYELTADWIVRMNWTEASGLNTQCFSFQYFRFRNFCIHRQITEWRLIQVNAHIIVEIIALADFGTILLDRCGFTYHASVMVPYHGRRFFLRLDDPLLPNPLFVELQNCTTTIGLHEGSIYLDSSVMISG